MLPILYDGLDFDEVSKAQHKEFPDILQYFTEKRDEYTLINPFKPEFTIVIFIHYDPRIAVAILDL